MNSSAGPVTSVLLTFKRLLVCALFLAALVTIGVAQTNIGSIKGTVTDQFGGLVVDATVVAKDAQGAEKTTTTSSTAFNSAEFQQKTASQEKDLLKGGKLHALGDLLKARLGASESK